MALNFTSKIKKDMLNAWKESNTIYVCAIEEAIGSSSINKLDCKVVSFPTTSGSKLTYPYPINLSIPENKTVARISLTTDITDHQTIQNNLIASEAVNEVFQYGGTYRINQIDIELTWKKT